MNSIFFQWIGFFKRIILLCFATLIVFFCVSLETNGQSETNVYFIPGQGADYRLFDSIQLDSGFTMVHVHYTLPDRGVRMTEYAKELAKQIDTTQQFILIGTSLGGMLAAEMTDIISPEKVIIISSAKNRKELPFRYRFQKHIPLFEIMPRFIIKAGARFLQPLVESDSKNNRPTFKAMLKDKDSRFLKRTIRMIVNWDRVGADPKIIHIHGEADKTIPIQNVKFNYRIENGSHMMTLTQFEKINQIINKELSM
jgi:pimeloyl-ACP methyl ester carboxylesterase